MWEYVRRDQKAWTQANANPWCVAAELTGFAEWDTPTWNSHPNMLANCAAWIAEECAHFDLPIRKLSPAEAQGGARGVAGHVDLGQMGGNHWDPGPSFPWDAVLALAQGVTPPSSEEDMPLNDDDKEWISKAINDALRQQFRPEGECYGRVLSADAEAIRRTPANIPK